MTQRKWFALAALMPAMAMVFVDQAVLPVALPTIQKHLGATTNELWWCINSYLLASALFLLAGGKIGDRIGYRATYLWGILIFAISSLLCGLSFNVLWLIGARALQGVGAALLIPATSPILMALFPPKERGKAIGLNVSISSLFLVLAPFIGGYFTEEWSWRWIFYINLPLAAIGLLLVLWFIPRSPIGHQKFDPWGFCFFVLFGGALIMLIMQAGEWGWDAPATIAMAVAGTIGGLLLFWRERRAAHPFIDLSLFHHPIYRAVNISIFATQFALMVTIYRAIFFQEGLNWSPMESGTVLSLTSMPILFVSPLGGWLADRFGPKVPLAIGFALLGGSFFWLAFVIQGTMAPIVIGLLAFGIGVPMVFTPSYASAMSAVPTTKAGLAFGVIATTRAFAASLGVAVISSFAYWVQFRSMQTQILSNPATANLNLASLEDYAISQESLSAGRWQIVQEALHSSQIDGFVSTHLFMGFAVFIAFVLVFVLYRRKASHHLPGTPAEGWD